MEHRPLSREDFRRINREVMIDTQQKCESMRELQEPLRNAINDQYMVAHEDNIDQPVCSTCNTIVEVNGFRSFTAAKKYTDRHIQVAVLNFANSHAPGGAPFSAGAQEESLCRMSTLYPCLKAMEEPFYAKHRDLFVANKIGYMGNDDLIYTPDVCVFKKEVVDGAGRIIPQMMPQEDWYFVNVITCAAPEMHRMGYVPSDYEEQITSRIKKILDVAAKERNEALILGAWGCGAFKNPSEVVARVFHKLLKNYNFKYVDFALGTNNISDSAFTREFSKF